MLKIDIISIIKAVSTCASSGKRMCLLDVYVCFWKFQEVSQSCNMLQLGVEQCGRVSPRPVCRYVLTIFNVMMSHKCDGISVTITPASLLSLMIK